MSTDLCDHAIEILSLTHDGDDLDPTHLKLVEMGVNGVLNDNGVQAFNALLADVRKGYTKPWFHGVEHITRDHDGNVRWKGTAIEHYSGPSIHSEQAAEAVRELARRCLLLEAQGITPTANTVVWQWKED